MDDAAGNRVDGFEGLVKNEHVGIVNEGAGEQDFFRHARGVVGNIFVGGFFQAERVKEFADAGGEVGFGDAAEGTKVLKIFFPGEAVEDREAVGKQPHGGFGGDGVMPHVKTADYCLAGVGAQKPGGHVEHGGFACAVGANDAEDAAAGNGEVEVVDGYFVPKFFIEAGDHHCGIVLLCHVLLLRLFVFSPKLQPQGTGTRLTSQRFL